MPEVGRKMEEATGCGSGSHGGGACELARLRCSTVPQGRRRMGGPLVSHSRIPVPVLGVTPGPWARPWAKVMRATLSLWQPLQ